MAQINKPNTYFNTKLWTGTGASNSITGVGFQPDLAWIKRRNTAGGNMFTDIIRGVTKTIISNETSAEQTFANGLTSFDSDGFTVGSEAGFNANGDTFVGWNWLAGGTAVSNTQGSITSSVSANQTAGFSIVSYTGTGANASIGHGLNSVPKFIVVKCRSNIMNWPTYNANAINGVSGISFLDVSDAEANYGTSYWQTTPTSSLFYVGSNTNTNNSGYTYVAYCWSEVKGFSKFGKYTGNGSTDGTFVYTGFKPAWVMFKVTNVANNWYLQDSKRATYNTIDTTLSPSGNNPESDFSTNYVDFLSNGFKLRNANTGFNASSNSYIYMAFAENPLVGTNNIPATAR